MPEVVDKSAFDFGGKTLIALTPNGNQLCVTNKAGLSKVLQMNNPEEEPEVFEIPENVTSVVCDSNTSFIVTTLKGDCFRYDFSGKDQLLARSMLPMRDCDVVHNGKMVVIGGDDMELSLVELSEGFKRYSIKADEQVAQLSYSSQTNLLSVSYIDGRVCFYSISSTRPNKVKALEGYIPKNSYNDDHRDELLNHGDEEKDDADDDTVRDVEFRVENRICARAAWHANGLHFALPCHDYTVKIFSIKDYKLMKTLSNPHSSKAFFIDLKFEPLHGLYLAAVDHNNRLTIWNWQTSEVFYKKELGQRITNFVWKVHPDNKTLDIILGTWSGNIINVKRAAESTEENLNKTNQTKGLFVDSEADEEENLNEPNLHSPPGEVFTDDENDTGAKRHHYDDEQDFVDDDDGAGYVSEHPPLKRAKQGRGRILAPSLGANFQASPKPFTYRPLSQGATPFGNSDRRYLTMNNVGYVCVVRNNEQNSITVSFFDIGRFVEYHFEDVFGFDVCSLNENGALFAQSKAGQLHYRPHNSLLSPWTKTLPLQRGERITSVSHTPKRVFVGTSLGYVRIFNEHGVPLMVEKMSPIVALTAQDYKVFAIHFHNYHGITYSLFERSPTSSKYYQRESPLPLTLPQDNLQLEDIDSEFVGFNTLGIKNFFFSAYGDPCVFGIDNVLLVLSKWRSATENRWLPVLDANMEIWKMSGGKETDVKVWPLGLNYDMLNCILVKGRNMWPEFPLPLPSEMEMSIPIFVKSKLLEEQNDQERNGGGDDDEMERQELKIPVQWAAEESFLRSKVLSILLSDTLAHEGELYGNENEILASLTGVHDKSLLRLFAGACTEQNNEMALSLAQDLKQDRALNAAIKIAERAELLQLVKRIDTLRESRIQNEIHE
ncbi:hypothetical protein ZYGR_0H00190 [Zygosaccharomyces rouxii]|uniref:ZYRO0B04466p n=2 Tax=Zygosaccharomyces rouxii TaxID=4956 RepID=C5DR01_ZYGRC|nr:uncharacterized protein ZYRO0B04466g [Zygosaccharomyces rouxii]KAH9200239.1 WD40-repeat-containing domain protein [Zygosaccharomyces rouxii]GAV47180.1 hypothetical protein ZYGR_0H00190 [Zygosaccharomyces rouxii]CAR26212.1 ZYRO0B04466p [Zygosaccharomyces rouxii]